MPSIVVFIEEVAIWFNKKGNDRLGNQGIRLCEIHVIMYLTNVKMTVYVKIAIFYTTEKKQICRHSTWHVYMYEFMYVFVNKWVG